MTDDTDRLWKRDPNRIYPGDFTVHSYTKKLHPSVNGWDLLEVHRVYHWNHSPLHRIEETKFHVGTELDPRKFQAGHTKVMPATGGKTPLPAVPYGVSRTSRHVPDGYVSLPSAPKGARGPKAERVKTIETFVKNGPPGGFLRVRSFSTLEDAQHWAAMVGDLLKLESRDKIPQSKRKRR